MTAPTRLSLVLANAQAATEELQRDVPPWSAPNFTRERLDHSGILPVLPAADVAALVRGELQQTPFLAHVRAWHEQTARPILVLSGPQGRGKTLCAAWVLGDHGGRYVGVEDFVRLAAARWGAEASRFIDLASAHTLVLDDVGRESTENAERVRAALVELVDKRRGERMRTIITTNLSAKDFATTYPDPRLTSRLSQSALWRTDTGADMRRKGTP
jgi:DNA replication protein DnaC